MKFVHIEYRYIVLINSIILEPFLMAEWRKI